MPSPQDIAQYQERLATHRTTLATRLTQQAALGSAHTPPEVAHDIREARTAIAQLKATLRGWGVPVEDLPDDGVLVPSQPVPAPSRMTTASPKPRTRPTSLPWRNVAGALLTVVVVSLLTFIWASRTTPTAPTLTTVATVIPIAPTAVPPTPALTVVPTTMPTAAPTALPAWVPELVKVPTGPFLMGSNDADTQASGNEKPQHTVTLDTYWIGKTEVTNAQLRQFVDSDGYTNRDYWTAAGWAWRQTEKITQPAYWNDPQWNGANYPVVGVSWFEAVAYCRWLSKQTGIAFRLPSEAEWEKAARGPDGRIYPWGNTWNAKLANSSESGLNKTTPVGQYPDGSSPYGAFDMAGNVWEWCVTQWGKPYFYQLEDEWQTAYLEAATDRVVRGGAYPMGARGVRGAYRAKFSPGGRRDPDQGLRVVSSNAK